MVQFARPSVDTTRDNWVEDDDTTVDIFDQIDEVSADDADYIQVLAPTNDIYVTKLTALEDPLSSSGHIVRYRYSKDAAGGGGQIDLTVELRQGYINEGAQGTLIHSQDHINIGVAWTAGSFTLSGAEADMITDYTDLYLRFWANQW